MIINYKDYDIKLEKVPDDVINLFSSLSEKRKLFLQMSYGSGRDFIIILFYFRFILGNETSKIAKKLNVQSESIHNQLYNFGWNYSQDYDENKKLFNKRLEILDQAVKEAKEKSKLMNEDHEKIINQKLLIKIRTSTYIKSGFSSKEEYIRCLYYLINIRTDIPPKEYIHVFGLTVEPFHERLRVLGLNKSHKEGIEGKKARKSQDYGATFRHMKNTRVESWNDNFIGGSNNENFVRAQIANRLYDFIDKNKYEAVVGFNNIGILGPLEIDIPIMIFDIEKNKLFRFVFEYNAIFWHNKDRDKNKKVNAENRGWIYLYIEETNGSRFSNNQDLIVYECIKICKEIGRIINS